ncbi:MAG: P-loop NTPase [candidate division KSB1 bacterium]|nr:P-loop NTPase [candidate division KSB1 bacterium]
MTAKSLTFRDLVQVLDKRKKVLLLSLAACLVPMVIYNEKTVPVYMAQAKIVFENYPTGQTIGLDIISPLARQNYIANRLEEMRTVAFARRVAAALPDSITEKILSTADVSKLRNLRGYPIAYIRKRLDARLIQGTDVVMVSFESTDPVVAATVTNAVIDVLQRSNLEQRRQEYTALRSFADEQLSVVERRLREAEDALKAFKEREGIATLDGEATEILERMTQAEVLLNNIRSEMEAKQRKLTLLRQQIETEKKDLPSTVTSLSTPITEKLKQRLVELETTYAKLQAQNYPADHPKLVEIRNDIEQTKANLVQETMRLVQDEKLQGLLDPLEQIGENLKASVALEVEIQGLAAQRDELQKLMATYEERLRKLPEQEVTLVRLQRELEVNNKLFQTLYEERERARIREAAEMGTMRVMERAAVPTTPVRPRKVFNLLIAIVAGLVIGFTVALTLEVLHDRPETPEDVQTFTALPVLASIPRIQRGILWNGSVKPLVGAETGTRGQRSVLHDAYDLLWSSFHFALDRNARIIMVTSSIPGEGKSTVAANLAILAGKRGLRTILVDGDLRKPMLHQFLEVPRQPGVSDLLEEITQILSDRRSLDQYLSTRPEEIYTSETVELGPIVESFLKPTQFPNLQFLPAGSPSSDSAGMWFMPEFSILLRALRERAALVILDMPPSLGLADANVAARLADGILFCIAAGETERRTIQRALANLEKTKARIIGVVLNKVNQTMVYGSKKYYKYYSRYYASEKTN